MRITPEAPQKHLAWYEWDDFLQHVVVLLQRAKAKYPEVRNKLVTQESRIGAENLRGLAAAANALSNESVNGDSTAPGLAPPIEGRPRPTSLEVERSTSPEPSTTNSKAPHDENAVPSAPFPPDSKDNPIFNDDTDAEIKLLPRYIIKTVGPEGWRTIGNAKEWYAMLLEKAYAVWADGVCNVLVELLDLPAPVVLAAPTVQGMEKYSPGNSGKKKPKRVSFGGVVGMFK